MIWIYTQNYTKQCMCKALLDKYAIWCICYSSLVWLLETHKHIPTGFVGFELFGWTFSHWVQGFHRTPEDTTQHNLLQCWNHSLNLGPDWVAMFSEMCVIFWYRSQQALCFMQGQLEKNRIHWVSSDLWWVVVSVRFLWCVFGGWSSCCF